MADPIHACPHTNTPNTTHKHSEHDTHKSHHTHTHHTHTTPHHTHTTPHHTHTHHTHTPRPYAVVLCHKHLGLSCFLPPLPLPLKTVTGAVNAVYCPQVDILSTYRTTALLTEIESAPHSNKKGPVDHLETPQSSGLVQ